MGHVTYFFKFWDPLHISGTAETRKFKFGTQIATRGPNEKNAKLGQKGSRDLLFEILVPPPYLGNGYS